MDIENSWIIISALITGVLSQITEKPRIFKGKIFNKKYCPIRIVCYIVLEFLLVAALKDVDSIRWVITIITIELFITVEYCSLRNFDKKKLL